MTTSLLTLERSRPPPTLRVVEKTRSNRLAEIREKRGMSQDDLADLMDVAQQQIHRWEWGDLKMSAVRRLAKALNCAEQDFFGAPEAPSLEGWTADHPQTPLPDQALLSEIITYVEAYLDSQDLELPPEKRASLIGSLYQLACDQAADRGIPPSQADLHRYDNVIRLQA